MTKGHEFYINGRICFPDDGSPTTDGTYRSMFGPCAPHDGVIYADNDCNFRLGVHKRTLGVRGTHAQERAYRSAQGLFLSENPELCTIIHDQLDELKELNNYVDLLEAAREHHADPHAKRLLRISAMEELEESGEVNDTLWLRRILLKAKKNEWAKHSKPQRGIGDLGVAASLQGFYVTKILKNAMAAAPFLFGGGEAKFINRPATSELRDVFKNLISPERRFYFAFFSDDSTLSIRMPNGEVRIFNLDIKSCDCSHSHYLFQLLEDICPIDMRPAIRTLVDQLRLEFEIVSTQDKRNKVRLRPHTAKLQSGSTITTLINNLACLVIMYSICKLRGEINAKTIKSAAAKCGYQLTVDTCIDYSQIQFLKHSPVYDVDGQLQPMLNLGVLLRSLGTCKGDLPGRGDIDARARRFNGALLHGMYPRCNFPLLEALKRGTEAPDDKSMKVVTDMFKYKVHHDTLNTFTLASDEVYRRYRHPFEGSPLRADEEVEMDECFGCLGVGMHYASPATDKILRQDYQLRARYHRNEPEMV